LDETNLHHARLAKLLRRRIELEGLDVVAALFGELVGSIGDGKRSGDLAVQQATRLGKLGLWQMRFENRIKRLHLLANVERLV
jgi:hypothetical protein